MIDVDNVNNELIDSQLITPKKEESEGESGDEENSPTNRIKKSQVVTVNGAQVTS